MHLQYHCVQAIWAQTLASKVALLAQYCASSMTRKKRTKLAAGSIAVVWPDATGEPGDGGGEGGMGGGSEGGGGEGIGGDGGGILGFALGG